MWIDKLTGENASALATRLAGLKDEISTSSRTSKSIAYSANGLIIRQQETVTTVEYRGLTKAAADLLCTLGSDTTTSTVYYKQIGTSSEYAAVGITSGTKTEYSATRANEANGWTVTKTTQTFGAANANGWTTTRPSGSTTTGIQISKDLRKSFVFVFDGDQFQSSQQTTVTEYRFLTSAEADTLIANNSSNNVQMKTFIHYNNELKIYDAWSSAQKGTNKSASKRYVDAANGYTVTVTETVFDASGNNWSLQT